MEDGELVSYDPSLEWPGADEFPNAVAQSGPSNYAQPSSCTFRLLVDQSAILPKTQRVAVVDGYYSELQFGRDVAPSGSKIPRLRLKEMEVSKLHATACWDKARSEWTLLDMGSKHGTFHTSQDAGSSGTRLSPPRVASMPRRLRHLDRFTIGGTAFVVHIHQDGLPCGPCYPTDGEEIPLFDIRAKQKEAESLKRKRDSSNTGPMVNTEKDPKKALTLLKRSLLSRRDEPSKEPPEIKSNWVDRSALRRALHPSREPIVSRKPSPAATPPPVYTPSPRPIPPVIPPPPITSTNVGHRMLQKQGWTPGTSLGQTMEGEQSTHRVEPIDVNANVGRSGLGSAPPPTVPQETSSDWRDSGKRRRWSNFQP